MKTVVVTGATAGFGEAIARKFHTEGYRVVLTGRRQDRLEALQSELGERVHSLCFDVRNPGEVEAAFASLQEDYRQIDVLVNNAGLAVGIAPLQDGLIDDWDRMIDTNVKGLLYVTRTFCAPMIERNSGHIINIGSIAGKEVYPGGNVYCASKFAVDALSRAMRIDMLKHGIKVTQIAPGLAETEFSVVRFKGDQDKADLVYRDMIPLYADDIAEAAWFAATRPPHVNIDDMVILATAQASSRDVLRKA